MNVGDVFGYYVVVGDSELKYHVLCRCNNCNTVKDVSTGNLRAGYKQCKDCANRERSMTHGRYAGIPKKHPTPEGNSLRGAIDRCYQTSHISYKKYGGRGIRVCDRWLGPDGYKNFCEDMGPRPEGMTLERKNRHGDYEPDNCVWADGVTQARNKGSNHCINIDGTERCIAEWSELTGVNHGTIWNRLKRGLSPFLAVFGKYKSGRYVINGEVLTNYCYRQAA